MEWRHSDSPRPKIFRVQKSARKFVALIFWYEDGLIFIAYFPRRRVCQYGVLLISVDANGGQSEGECGGKFIKLILFLHDSAPDYQVVANLPGLPFS